MLTKMVEEVSASDVLEEEVDSEFILKYIIHL
jgi:hypothetical protein